ncbi:hypothetical protein K4A83_08050 [Spirulina subsalsa FACHB-351]|uniref:Uncharacterized protein n=1 Tax=Spirulina subsalsa FACHB-351 TaxID=234711 RepID=A0ABT3L3X9_9CYAN|nr:hypothetical protein [Spirulina subsalsa]MCW6036223.1 hypothetical protein [Spirulina subsalsa FACHB-351]
MFLDELTPLGKELLQQPIAFMGGFFSGVFKLNLNEDPLKSWLKEQGAVNLSNSGGNDNNGNNNNGPQPIQID